MAVAVLYANGILYVSFFAFSFYDTFIQPAHGIRLAHISV